MNDLYESIARRKDSINREERHHKEMMAAIIAAGIMADKTTNYEDATEWACSMVGDIIRRLANP